LFLLELSMVLDQSLQVLFVNGVITVVIGQTFRGQAYEPHEQLRQSIRQECQNDTHFVDPY